ncbi:hypothetical protein [Roseofilum capinflatum]|uniref:Uncharacterized protein n=1 Tax=Roseofilum capinflatum BLCC-M114 TaxID=3022440 RepID=A0ABT7B5B6_9CYAN|nr:hypothetical protein [Roseofilum capinflatum]MDJ1173453.1 hypothetical protein [Roseofilum capinflatum BLCC-M114]
MTQLLEEAIAQLKQLPEDQQDAFPKVSRSESPLVCWLRSKQNRLEHQDTNTSVLLVQFQPKIYK